MTICGLEVFSVWADDPGSSWEEPKGKKRGFSGHHSGMWWLMQQSVWISVPNTNEKELRKIHAHFHFSLWQSKSCIRLNLSVQEHIILPQPGKLRTIEILLNITWIIKKDACILIAALFTIAKTWKQHKCQLTGMDKEDVVPIHNEV